MDKYEHLHVSPNGPGDARPTADQILLDENLVGKLTGKTILITGGTAGLGTESARVLRKTGAKVWITARNKTKGDEVVKKISDQEPNAGPEISILGMELSNLDSVRAAAKTFLQECSKLNILMTNAGVMACPHQLSAQNYELQFASNHLGHFLLFQLLKPALLAASTPSFNSRVISLSSCGHRASSIRPDDYHFEKRKWEYAPFAAYGQTKTANILMANEIERRYGAKGLHAWSVHPGTIFETEISRHQEGGANGLQARLTKEHAETPKIIKNMGQGTATQVWAAVGKDLEGKGGLYLEDCQVSKPAKKGGSRYSGHAECIYDEELARVLWRDSLKMVGLEEEEEG